MSSSGQDSSTRRIGWWGRFTLGVEERALWHLGPMKLGLTRRAREWSVLSLATEEWRTEALVECPTEAVLDEKGVVRHRFSFRESPDSVRVGPAAPDRHLVVYPESAFHIIAGERITLFCSIPLWIQVETDDGDLLLDQAIDRPADTWVGSSTREGELCYATKTMARLDRSAVPKYAHRAVTELHIDNYAADTLHLERVNLAVPYLSLFSSADGSLETEPIVLERTSVETMGTIEIGEPNPERGLQKVSPPRRTQETSGHFARAFGAWFA